MTPLEAIQKIKQMFAEAGELPVAEAPASKMAEESAEPIEAAKEYVLESGQKVLIDKLEIGGKVSLLDEAGQQSPAPVGEHKLADGTKVTVDEAGVILAVELPQAEVVEEVMPEAPAQPSEQDMMKEKIAEMQKQLDEIKMAYDAKMAQQEARFSKGISDISDVLVQLINTPSASATEQPKDKFNVHVESKDAKLERFLQFAKSIK